MPKGVYERKGKKGYIQPRCPKCSSLSVQARIVKNDMWCRRCGYIGKRKDFYERD